RRQFLRHHRAVAPRLAKADSAELIGRPGQIRLERENAVPAPFVNPSSGLEPETPSLGRTSGGSSRSAATLGRARPRWNHGDSARRGRWRSYEGHSTSDSTGTHGSLMGSYRAPATSKGPATRGLLFVGLTTLRRTFYPIFYPGFL